MSIEIQTAIETIATNEWSGIVVGSDSSIEAVIGLDSIPSLERLQEISDRYGGCAFQFVPRGDLNHQQLEEIVKSLVEAIEYSRTHEMRLGVNIPLKK
jgi:hypothetical protein